MPENLNNKKQLIIAAIVLVIIIGTAVNFYKKHSIVEETNNSKDALYRVSEDSKDAQLGVSTIHPKKKTKEILIQITGAVKKPGIYTFTKKIRTKDALAQAGGVLPTADLEKVNLVRKIRDGQKINVPVRKDAKLRVSTKKTINTKRTDAKFCVSTININTGSLTALQSLPGIGAKKAQQIIEYRNTNGRFQSKEEITKIKGIGEKRYQKIKDQIEI